MSQRILVVDDNEDNRQILNDVLSGAGYDIIEADALRPTSAFAGNLYSVEYFALLRDHLEPGGYAVTWAATERDRPCKS